MLDRRRAARTWTRDGVVWLLKSFDAMIAERDGNFERVPWHRTASHLRAFRAVEIRSLLSEPGNRSLGLPWPIWDSHIMGLAQRKLRDGDLVMLLERRSAAPEPEHRDREGVIARSIARALRGEQLVIDGGRFRVVPGYAIADLPGRDDYQVVRRAQADALLEKAAVAAADPGLRDALTQARGALAADAQAPQKLAGIVLLRYQAPRRMSATTESAALTPAQLKAALAKDWIEVRFETSDGAPCKGRAELAFPDGRVEEANIARGLLRYDNLVSGRVQVTLTEIDPRSAPRSASS